MAKNAVLANLTIRKFSNEVNDRSVAAVVARENHASVSEDKYIKKRLSKHQIKEITTIISRITTTHRSWTSPWLDGGIRILPAQLVLKYLAVMKELRLELRTKVEKVADALVAIDAESQRTRGTLYNPNDIPSKDQFINAFDVRIDILPFSTSDDFRVDIISDQMKKEFDETLHQKLSLNTPHVIHLFTDPISRLSTASRYYQSTLDKLQFACDVAVDMVLDETLKDKFEALSRLVEDEVLCFDIEDVRNNQNTQERFLNGLTQAQTLLENLANES